ncbi:MAG: HIT domain-containing protein [Clostridia bacterium]|nr:HIT domain-containing protein [Clostridia bacterium]
MDNCVFCKIIAGQIPSAKLYEDDELIVIKDIAPRAKVHCLCIPKEHFALLEDMDESRALIVKRALQKIPALKKELGVADGFRLVVNQGENAGQTVHHLHIHILGGEPLPWE